MKTLSVRIAGLSRRNKALLAAVSALLVIVIVAGVVLALRPTLAARLAGAAAGGVYPPGWDPNGAGYTLRSSQAGAAPIFLTQLDMGTAGYAGVALQEKQAGDNRPNHIWGFEISKNGYFMLWQIYGLRGSELLVSYLTTATQGQRRADGREVCAYPFKFGSPPADGYLWRLLDAGDGLFQFQRWESGLCLEVQDDGMGVRMATCDSQRAAQRWQLQQQ